MKMFNGKFAQTCSPAGVIAWSASHKAKRRHPLRRNGATTNQIYADRLASITDLGVKMTKIEERTTANMDVVLEEVCRSLPHGGDHESRKYVAKKLMQCAKKGNVTLEELRAVASRAFSELTRRKSA